MREKIQTPAQRTTNAEWLRSQIRELIKECSFNIDEDQGLADKARDASRDKYLERVENHRHWKCQLERILSGKTSHEALEFLAAEKGARG
jgi:hypothetical protein